MVDIAIFSWRVCGVKVTVPQRQKKVHSMGSCMHFCVYSWRKTGPDGKVSVHRSDWVYWI